MQQCLPNLLDQTSSCIFIHNMCVIYITYRAQRIANTAFSLRTTTTRNFLDADMINMSFTMLGVYLMYAGQMSGGSLSATGSTNLPSVISESPDPRQTDSQQGQQRDNTTTTTMSRSYERFCWLLPHVSDLWCGAAVLTPLDAQGQHELGGNESPTEDNEAVLRACIKEDLGWTDELPHLALVQRAVWLIAAYETQASFTDLFLDRVWPLTTAGERDLAAAADLDPEVLRLRWIAHLSSIWTAPPCECRDISLT